MFAYLICNTFLSWLLFILLPVPWATLMLIVLWAIFMAVVRATTREDPI